VSQVNDIAIDVQKEGLKLLFFFYFFWWFYVFSEDVFS
jgi:hypothetical protein